MIIFNQSKGHVYGGLAARFAGRPAVWWQQGIPERSLIEIIASAVPSAALVVSGRDAEQAQRRLTPRRRVQLIHPGTEVRAVADRAGSGDEVRESLGWSSNQIVGIVGRLQAWKGQKVFLQAAAQLAQAHPDSRYVVVGGAILGWEGDYPQQLQRLASDLGISECVHFAGHQDDVYPWFDAMDVVVHASFGESFGLILVEAMALGKPLVAAAAGGPLEIVEDGVSGLLVPPGDDAALAGAIERILDDPGLASSLAAGARDRAAEFSSEAMTARFATLLTDLTSPRYYEDSPSLPLVEHAVAGLHAHLVQTVLAPLARPGDCCVDLGAGSGALAVRLQQLGLDVLAADRDADAFEAPVPFCEVDLDSPAFAETLGLGCFELVTAVEVIEHLEAPLAFLRGVAELLAPGGAAVLTTPNLDNALAQMKFLLKGKLYLFDEWAPAHISPIFWDLLVRQYLPLAGLALREHHVYPTHGFVAGRPVYRRLLGIVGPLLARSPRLVGDSHVIVVARATDPAP